MKTIKSLLVLWKNSTNNLYYHVGTLYFDGALYTFHYTLEQDTHRKVGDALRNGYRLHPAFPILETVYKSKNLFSAFDRRIPSSDRVDYKDILINLGLSEQADRMDILCETRGMLAGDSYSFEQPIRLYEDRHLMTSFYINGMRHRKLPSSWPLILQNDKKLNFIIEEENPGDPNAVRIETSGGLHLGYVPSVYAKAIKSLIQQNIQLSISIKGVRPESAPQWWVSLTIEADLKENQLDFVNDSQLNGLIQLSA